ncbi:hypothetical protein MSG28_010859, partial [Choristoneura fumiferana]
YCIYEICLPLPSNPILRKLDDLRFQHVKDSAGNYHLVDMWMTLNDISEVARYNPTSSNVYHLFTRNNPTTSQPLLINNPGLLELTEFSNSRRTIVLLHGWRDGAFLAAENVNVIVVDWSEGSSGLYSAALENTVSSGQAVAQFINWLNEASFSSPVQYHIVGHGLGGHKAGIVARHVEGSITYVTGLDPSLVGWINHSDRFQPTDAAYTEVIHTNCGVNGYLSDLADVDFYPNGGESMPGCDSHACDHERAVHYFGESITTGGFTGRQCINYMAAILGTCNIMPLRLEMGGLRPKMGIILGCASLMYLNGDKMSVSLSFGKKVITNRTLSSRKPTPVCMPLPGGISKFCGRVYNIARAGEEFRACLGDVANDVESADYTGFSLLGEDIIGDLFGSTGGKKANKNKNKNKKKQAPTSTTTTTTTTTTKRPRPSRRPSRRPNRTTTPRPAATRTTTVRVRPVNRRPTRRPTRRPENRPPRPSRRPPTSTSVEVTPTLETSPAISSTIATPTIKITTAGIAMTESTPISSAEKEQTFEPVLIVTQKPMTTLAEITVKDENQFEDPGLEMSLAQLTGQLSVVPVTPILPTSAKVSSMMTTNREQTNYEKIETITPKTTFTAAFDTSSEDAVNDDMVQIVHDLDSHSEENISIKPEQSSDESRAHYSQVVPNDFYGGLSLPKKNRGNDFGFKDFDVLGLSDIGETVGEEIGLFGKNKRNNKKNNDVKKSKGVKGRNNDDDDILGLEALSESLGLSGNDNQKKKKQRGRQNKMMRGEIILTNDRSYEVIKFQIPKSIWREALNPTPVLRQQATIVLPIHVAQDDENYIEDDEDDIEEPTGDNEANLVQDAPVVEPIVQSEITNAPTVANITEKPLLDEETTTLAPQNVNGSVFRFPCSCVQGQCGCCTGTIMERFKMKACGNISFVPEDFVFDVRMSVNNRTVVRRRVSASDPPPICFNPARAPFVRVCAEISNIRIRNRNAFACLDINADIAGFQIYSASFRCFGLFGNSGDGDDNRGGFLSNAAGAIFGGGDSESGGLFGGGGGIFGGGDDGDDGGPLDAFGDAVGDFFDGRKFRTVVQQASTNITQADLEDLEVPDSALIFLERLKARKFAQISLRSRQTQVGQNTTSTSEEDDDDEPNRRCTCSYGVCKCCTGYVLDLFNQKACMKVTYHPGDFAFDVAMSMNDRVLYENSMSGKNPKPICINPPRLRNLKVCAKFYNIFFPGRNFHFCLAMTGQWGQFELFNMAFDCLRMGANGLAMVGPEENGGIPIPNPQGGVDAVIDAGDDDIEEYDENNTGRIAKFTVQNENDGATYFGAGVFGIFCRFFILTVWIWDSMETMESMPGSPEVTYNWVDVTTDFFTHIQDLRLGELLHDGHLFGLFEAMSAIEMMDPKMDAGMLCNRGVSKPLNFQQAVQAGKLKIDDLEPNELIGVIDATMACIVSWLEGHSLAQTVFTNLAQVFEEEDFQPMGYGYRLGSNPQTGNTFDPNLEVSEQKCIAMLREQEEELNKKARGTDDEAREFVENFLARCVRPFAVLLQVCGHNRARQRDKLALLLDEFAALQEEALVAFKLQGKIRQPQSEFDNEAVRYKHRFAPLSVLTPPQVTDLLKVAKTNFVVLKLLAGGHKRDSTTPPEFDFTHLK